MQAHSDHTSLLALDVGSRRIGVARASSIARLAAPLTTLENTPEVYNEIMTLCKEHDVSVVVVGLPRGLDGQHTAQTQYVDDFVAELRQRLTVPIVLQDEALTSYKAEVELGAHSEHVADKGKIDALAATYILEDYLAGQGGEAS